MDELEGLIQKDLLYLEDFFEKFNNRITQNLNEKLSKIDILPENIDKLIILNKYLIFHNINKSREGLMGKLRQNFNDTFQDLNSKNNFLKISFRQNTLRLEETDLLLGQLNYSNKFTLIKKFNYFEYLNQYFYEIPLKDDLIRFVNVRILIMSLNRLFIYLRTPEGDVYFKIFNNKCQECYSTKVNPFLIYRNVLSFESKIVCLFNDPVKRENILSVYDSSLSLLKTIKCDSSIYLCSFLSNKEIICWNPVESKCLIYDINLDLVETLGQTENEKEAFYFKKGTLIESSKNLFLIYYFDDEELKHFIKIFDRSNGYLSGVINFDFNYFSKMIRIDSKSNILVKLYEPADEVKYYDCHGKLLKVFRNNDLPKYNRIDLSQDDDIICYDKIENKILFF